MVVDTGIWQGLASVAIPGIVINRIVWAVSRVPFKGRVAQIVPTVSKSPPSLPLPPPESRLSPGVPPLRCLVKLKGVGRGASLLPSPSPDVRG
jgi:hypothetical protein